MATKIKYDLRDMQAFQLGAEYIHSNWMYFENTLESSGKSGEDFLLEIAKDLHAGIIKIIEKEMSYYKQIETAFIKDSKNSGRNVSVDRNEFLKEIRTQYENQKNDPTTEIGDIFEFTGKLNAVRKSPRFFKNKKTEEITYELLPRNESQSKSGLFLEEFTTAVNESGQAILEIFNDQQRREKLGYNNWKVHDNEAFGLPKRRGKAKKLKLTDPAVKKGAQDNIDKINEKVKRGERLTLEDGNILKDMMNSLNLKYWVGKAWEPAVWGLFANYLEGITESRDGKISEKYKKFNTIDEYLMKVKIAKKQVMVGLNIKYHKQEPMHTNKYKLNHDIYDVVNAFGSEALKLPGASRIEKNAKFLLYIRKNLIALESFSLDSPKGIIGKDSFIAREALLAFLMNFFRFFNGVSYLLATGEFAPLEKSDKSKVELPLIYNVFFVTKQNIYYTYDLLKSILDMFKDFEKSIFKKKESGEFHRQTNKGFTAKATLSRPQDIKSSAANLWSKKRKIMKDLEKTGNLFLGDNLVFSKEPLTYDLLHNDLINDLKELGAKIKSPIDTFHFFIKPELIMKNLKK